MRFSSYHVLWLSATALAIPLQQIQEESRPALNNLFTQESSSENHVSVSESSSTKHKSPKKIEARGGTFRLPGLPYELRTTPAISTPRESTGATHLKAPIPGVVFIKRIEEIPRSQAQNVKGHDYVYSVSFSDVNSAERQALDNLLPTQEGGPKKTLDSSSRKQEGRGPEVLAEAQKIDKSKWLFDQGGLLAGVSSSNGFKKIGLYGDSGGGYRMEFTVAGPRY